MGRYINPFTDFGFKKLFAEEAMTNEQVKQYEESLKIYRDNINVINTAKKEGYDEGKMESKLEDALNFLKLGINETIVAQGTGLTIEKIIELKRKLK